MKLQIGSRMRAGFLAMAALLVVGGLVTILYTYRLQLITTRLLADNLSSLGAAQELEVSLFRMRGLTSSYILDGDPRWLSTLEDRKEEFRGSLFRAKDTARSRQEEEVLSTIASLFAEYEDNLHQVLTLNKNRDQEKAKHLLAHATLDVFEAIYQKCEAFVAINESFMVVAIGKIERTNGSVRTAMYGLGLLGLAMGYFLGALITRSIEKPICELVLKVRDATADGMLVEHLDIAGGGGMEELDRHVHELITRINTTRADLERNRRLLARADKLAALGKVSAGIAHEIRNPLAAIKILIYTMRRDLAGDDEKFRDLDVITKEVDRMDRFIGNFLSFARPPDPSLARIDINAVVRETMELLRPRLRESQVELMEQYQPDTGSLLVDPDQIKQVIMNLVLNAVEAMQGGGVLTVETLLLGWPAETDSRWVQIRITDTGPGIQEERLDDIFDPFVSGREDGTGLGLSISHQIVLRHRGMIDVANIPGGGATFTVSLPHTRG